MAVDIETLLTPVSDETPSGPDLAYDPVRAEIEQAFERSVSIDVTGAATAASDVDWRKIVAMIEKQCAETKDIWLAVYLCRAGAATGDLDLVVKGSNFLAGLCERFWDTVHPQLDEYGFQGRKGPCESLASVGAFLSPLRNITLLTHPRLGRFSAADFDRFRANGETEEGYGQFRAALTDTAEEALAAIGGRVEATLLSLKRVDDILTRNAEGDTGPNFAATYETLGQIKRGVAAFVSSTEAAPKPEADNHLEGISADQIAGPGAKIGGRVDSREDVVKALDAIGDYYRRREPGSPIPLLLQRAREWINLDFLQVLRDIAPGGLDEATRILRYQREEDEET